MPSTMVERSPGHDSEWPRERLIVKRRRSVKACDRCRGVRSRCSRTPEGPCTRCIRLESECTTTQPNLPNLLSGPLNVKRSKSISQGTPFPHSTTDAAHPPDPTRRHSSGGGPSSLPLSSPLDTPRAHAESIPLSTHLATEPRILGFTSLSSVRDEITDSYGVDRGDGRDDDDGDKREGKVPSRPEGKLVEKELSLNVIERLLSDFATHISPINPILLSHEVFSPERMSVVAISAVCAIASLSRTVPTPVFLAARQRVVELLEISDVLKVASVANIQTLLVATSKAEVLMSKRQNSGGSLSFQRCSSAIRMAQELGLHRGEMDFPPDVQRRRRSAWRSCLIADRWLAAGYGLPQIIDLDDCDDDIGSLRETDRQMVLQAELYKVSTLLGRVLKEIYTPKILERTNNDRVEKLILDIDACRYAAHDLVKFAPNSSTGSVVFELSILTVEALFLRGMTSSRIRIPRHVSYRPTVGRWKAISDRAQALASWIEEKGDWLLDTTRIGLYGLTFCSLMMFRDYVDNSSPGALRGLQIASRASSRWAEGNGDILHVYPGRIQQAQIMRTLFVVARDGTKNRGNGASSIERLHVVQPLAGDKASAPVPSPTYSPPRRHDTPPPLPPHISELEAGRSLLQLTDNFNAEAHLHPAPADYSPVYPQPDVNGYAVNATGVGAAGAGGPAQPVARHEEMAWAMPPMDNWLSEILEQEAEGNWNFELPHGF
ncbi:hypothetical protein IAT38_006323 [Cryptococcus sp. DSM 104549]